MPWPTECPKFRIARSPPSFSSLFTTSAWKLFKMGMQSIVNYLDFDAFKNGFLKFKGLLSQNLSCESAGDSSHPMLHLLYVLLQKGEQLGVANSSSFDNFSHAIAELPVW